MPERSPGLGPKDDYGADLKFHRPLKGDSVGDFKLNEGNIIHDLEPKRAPAEAGALAPSSGSAYDIVTDPL